MKQKRLLGIRLGVAWHDQAAAIGRSPLLALTKMSYSQRTIYLGASWLEFFAHPRYRILFGTDAR
jgi:hypothetical protein